MRGHEQSYSQQIEQVRFLLGSEQKVRTYSRSSSIPEKHHYLKQRSVNVEHIPQPKGEAIARTTDCAGVNCWTIADIAAWRGRRMKFGYFDDPAEAYAACVKGIEELCGLSLAEICPWLIRWA